MEIVSPIEPLRRFQIDPNYKSKLVERKKLLAQKTHIVEIDGVKVQASPNSVNLPIQYAKNVVDIQKMMYKNNDAHQKEMQFADFWYNSRQIFQFDNNLSDALSRTDIDEVPWSEIHFPYEDFYVSFGNSESNSFSVPDGNQFMIDGAYINFAKAGQSLIYNADSILIDFTSRLIEPDYKTAISRIRPGFLLGEPMYSFILSGETNDTVGDAIVKGEMNYLRYCDEMDRQNHELSIKFSKHVGISGMEDIKLSPTKDKYFRGKEFVMPSLSVLFNCIFYLSQYPENVQIKYNDHKAKVLYKNLDRDIEKEKKEKIRKEISANEYSRIRFVKDNKITQLYESIPTGKEVRTHWRRGHWRNQAHGEKNLQHSRKWIYPVLVNKDKGKPETGHIYEVENKINE